MRGPAGALVFAFIILCVIPAYSENEIPLDISVIVSADSGDETVYRTDVSPCFRYRAIYHRPLWAEASPWLEIQKIRSDGVSSRLVWSRKIDISSSAVTLKAFNEICGADAPPTLDCEAKIGCCRIDNIRWDELALFYRTYTRNHGSSRLRTFQCRADSLPEDDFSVACEEQSE